MIHPLWSLVLGVGEILELRMYILLQATDEITESVRAALLRMLMPGS